MAHCTASSRHCCVRRGPPIAGDLASASTPDAPKANPDTRPSGPASSGRRRRLHRRCRVDQVGRLLALVHSQPGVLRVVLGHANGGGGSLEDGPRLWRPLGWPRAWRVCRHATRPPAWPSEPLASPLPPRPSGNDSSRGRCPPIRTSRIDTSHRLGLQSVTTCGKPQRRRGGPCISTRPSSIASCHRSDVTADDRRSACGPYRSSLDVVEELIGGRRSTGAMPCETSRKNTTLAMATSLVEMAQSLVSNWSAPTSCPHSRRQARVKRSRLASCS